MIDPATLLALETKNELRIAIKLSTSEMPMRHKDISETLKINKQRCSNGTLAAGKVFEVIPVPSDTRRFYRLQVTSNFDASDVNLTAAITTLPLA